jgi:ABC-type polysaccharide/polyol phosphate transport system ATPase subunit
MKARLAFSIATMVEPEILIVDEVLSVGDTKFQRKSREKMQSLLNEDATVLFVSHSTQQVKNICKRAIWLHQGELIAEGSAEEVCDLYEKWVKEN